MSVTTTSEQIKARLQSQTMSRPGTTTKTTAPGTYSFKAADFSSPWKKTADEADFRSTNEYSQAPATPNNDSPSRGEPEDPAV